MTGVGALLDALGQEGDPATARLDHRAAATPDAVLVHQGVNRTDLTYAEARPAPPPAVG